LPFTGESPLLGKTFLALLVFLVPELERIAQVERDAAPPLSQSLRLEPCLRLISSRGPSRDPDNRS